MAEPITTLFPVKFIDTYVRMYNKIHAMAINLCMYYTTSYKQQICITAKNDQISVCFQMFGNYWKELSMIL